MKLKIAMLGVLPCLTLNGCETIKSYFPDKEKDYRYTNEIPALVIPQELQARSVIKPPPPIVQVAEPAKNLVEPSNNSKVVVTPLAEPMVQAIPLGENDPAHPGPVVEKALMDKNFAAEVDASEKPNLTEVKVVPAGKSAQLQVNQNLDRTWRIVGKALSRKVFEITERNTQDHYFLVQYDPDVQPMVDESMWDDVLFLFSEEKNRERVYKIGLTAQENQTTISLLTKDNQACEDEKCAKLFNLLQEAMHQAITE